MTPLEIPKRALDRPIFKGMLVPFTVKWFGNVPDFKVTDPAKVFRCVKNRLCGLCGKRIDNPVVFIGGELSLTNRMFTDPAMHEDCARYAFSVCPFLNGSITHMAETKREGVTTDTHVNPERPKRMGLLITDGWSMMMYDGNAYIRGNAGRIEWLTTTTTH